VKAVLTALKERVAKIKFKVDNPTRFATNVALEVDTEIDIMFECPGVPLSEGSQRYFHGCYNPDLTGKLHLYI
jgi:hypothetical protein